MRHKRTEPNRCTYRGPSWPRSETALAKPQQNQSHSPASESARRKAGGRHSKCVYWICTKGTQRGPTAVGKAPDEREYDEASAHPKSRHDRPFTYLSRRFRNHLSRGVRALRCGSQSGRDDGTEGTGADRRDRGKIEETRETGERKWAMAKERNTMDWHAP